MRVPRRTCITIVLVLGMLLLASTALAGGPYELLWYSIGAGGGECEGGAYALQASVGQSAGVPMTGGAYSLGGGFWSGVPPVYLRYLPVIFR